MMFVALEFPPESWTLSLARHAIDQLLATAQADDRIRGELAVVMTEACSNVVRHCGVPDPYRVRVEVLGDACLIEVSDCGTGFDPDRIAHDMPPVEDIEASRGLALIRALTDRLFLRRLTPRGMVLPAVKRLRHSERGPDGTAGEPRRDR